MEINKGYRFERLTAVCFSHYSERWHIPHWLFRCDCGKEKVCGVCNVVSGRTKSCGCLQKERASAARLRHGMSDHPAYNTWTALNNRCNNPNASDFQHYGGRGIRVCAAWRTFDGFWADMGASWALGLTIERVNNGGDYEAANCVWATWERQQRNRRNSKIIDTPWGRMSAAAAAEKADLPYGLFIQRVRAGWSAPDLFLPRRRRKD